MSHLGTAAYAQLAPLAALDAENGYVLRNLIMALNGPIEDVAEWISEDDGTPDGTPGYSRLLDLDRAPAVTLPWLGQMKGIRVTPGLSEAEQREEIDRAEGFHRGTIPSMERAAARHLTGTKTVYVLDRVNDDPYQTVIITRTAETPDPALTLADIMRDKKAGELLTHIVTDSPVIEQGTATIDTSTATIDTAVLADVVI
jgi:hypothetical protein